MEEAVALNQQDSAPPLQLLQLRRQPPAQLPAPPQLQAAEARQGAQVPPAVRQLGAPRELQLLQRAERAERRRERSERAAAQAQGLQWQSCKVLQPSGQLLVPC